MIADYGDPEEMAREVDREIIRYLAAHPQNVRDGDPTRVGR